MSSNSNVPVYTPLKLDTDQQLIQKEKFQKLNFF